MNNMQAEPNYGGNVARIKNPDDALITAKQAAKLLDVDPVTIRAWSRDGRFKSVATQGGHTKMLYRRGDIIRYGETHKIRHVRKRTARKAEPSGKLRPDNQTESARIARIVKLLNASGSPFDATVASVTRAALRLGLDALEKEMHK